MKLGRRTTIGGVLCATAAVLSLTTHGLWASAAPLDVDLAAFVGATTSLTCTPIGPNCTAGNGVPLMGGGGTFSFQSIACVGGSVSDTDENAATLDAEGGLCSIAANGNYTNIVCGTGMVTGGNAALSENATGPFVASDTYNISFGIIFVAGIGVETGTAQETGDPDTEPPAPADGLDVLTPIGSAEPPPSGECVTAFTVIGVAVTTA